MADYPPRPPPAFLDTANHTPTLPMPDGNPQNVSLPHGKPGSFQYSPGNLGIPSLKYVHSIFKSVSQVTKA